MSLSPAAYIGECHYCGTFGGTTRDHIVPASLGGPDGGWNIVRSCPRCNYEKADAWPTCGCDQCAAAVERFLSDARLRAIAAKHVAQRIGEFEYQLTKIEAAKQKITDRVTHFESVLEMLA